MHFLSSKLCNQGLFSSRVKQGPGGRGRGGVGELRAGGRKGEVEGRWRWRGIRHRWGNRTGWQIIPSAYHTPDCTMHGTGRHTNGGGQCITLKEAGYRLKWPAFMK